MRYKKLILVLTGEIATGKTTLSEELVKRYGFTHIKTRELLKVSALKSNTIEKVEQRGFLQNYGANLDKKTNGGWILNESQSIISSNKLILIDSARIKEQIDAFRKSFPQNVVHIHLTAPDEVKLQRFMNRTNKDVEPSNEEKRNKYEAYKADETERKVPELRKDADLVIHTDRQSFNDNVIQAASFLRLRASIKKANVDVVIGGQFGSEGKGQIAAHISPEYDCLIRVGGPNAGHKVYQENPHTFHLIPSGSHRNKQAKIVIGPGAVISLEKIMHEIAYYDVGDRLIIDENATVIGKEDILLEEKIDNIGSTKKGVGAATANNLLQNRLKSSDNHKAKNHAFLKPYIGSAFETYEKILTRSGKILLEGTQGTFLDLHHGFYPYVTSRPTTASGCIAEAGIGPGRIDKIIAVFRRYPIRVQNPKNGSSGPFSEEPGFNPEIDWNEVSKRSKITKSELVKTEKTTSTNRSRRVAEFNWALFRKSCELNTATDIAFTFADYIDIENRKARQFGQLTDRTKEFIEKMEQTAGIPVSLIASNFDFRAIIDRRKW